MKIVLVRHAETPENIEGKLQGIHHDGFTEKGYQHLRDLKKQLDLYYFDIAFVSDLPRTLETAKYVLYRRENIILEEKLIREKSSGTFAGIPVKDVNWDVLSGNFSTRKPPGGESLNDVQRRVNKFLNKLQKTNHKNVLVVSHGTFLKLLTGRIMGLDTKKSIFNHFIEHCSISTLKFTDNKFTILKLNSTTHLKN